LVLFKNVDRHASVTAAAAESLNRKILVQVGLGSKQDPISNVARGKSSKHCSSGGVSPLQALSPEFKPRSIFKRRGGGIGWAMRGRGALWR
jgi:hypothetical protein